MIGGYMTYEGPRTLMARPVCLTESLSKCLVTPFVESVYNQHSYREERDPGVKDARRVGGEHLARRLR